MNKKLIAFAKYPTMVTRNKITGSTSYYAKKKLAAAALPLTIHHHQDYHNV